MAQQLGELVALPEDLCSIPSTKIEYLLVAYNCSCQGNLMSFCDLH